MNHGTNNIHHTKLLTSFFFSTREFGRFIFTNSARLVASAFKIVTLISLIEQTEEKKKKDLQPWTTLKLHEVNNTSYITLSLVFNWLG